MMRGSRRHRLVLVMEWPTGEDRDPGRPAWLALNSYQPCFLERGEGAVLSVPTKAKAETGNIREPNDRRPLRANGKP